MMRLVCLQLALLAAWSTGAARNRGTPEAKLKPKLEAIMRCVVEAENRGDLEEYSKYHTEDCVVSYPSVKTEPCTEGFVSRQDPTLKSVLDGIDVLRVLSDNTAYSSIAVNREDSAGQTVVRSRLITLWRREDRQWRIERKFVNFKEIPIQDQIQAQIQGQQAILLDGLSRGDAERMLEVYVDDPIWLLHGFEDIIGRDAFRVAIENLFPLLKTVVLAENIFFELLADDVAYTTSTIYHIDENGRIFGLFRDDLLWRRVGDQWLIQCDGFNEVPLK